MKNKLELALNNNQKLSQNKRNLIVTSSYQLAISLPQLINFLCTITINYIVACIVVSVADGAQAAGVIDPITMMFSALFGAVIFTPSFKMALINGVSRKTYTLSTGITILIASLVAALVTFVLMLISSKTFMTINIYFALYGTNLAGLFFWQFGMSAVMISLGFLVRLVIYRTRPAQRLVLLVCLLAGIGILFIISAATMDSAYAIFAKIFTALSATNGGATTASPFIAMAYMLLFAILFSAVSFFVLKTADIKKS